VTLVASIGLAGAVGNALGWRWAFVIVGLPGVVTAFMVLRLKEPRRGHGDRLSMGLESSLDEDHHEHQKLFEHGIGTFASDMIRGLWTDVKTIMQIPTLKFVLVGVGVLLFSVSGIGYWLPIYYVRFLDLSDNQADGAVAVLLIVGGVAGTLIGGVLADRYQNRIKGGRIAIPAYTIMLGSVLFAVGLLSIPSGVAILIHLVAIFVFTLAVPAMRAGVGDAVPAHLRGAGFAAFGLISGVFGSAAAPPIIGVLSDARDLRFALLACMPIIFVGALVLLRARHHLDEDVMKVMVAVQRAYQEQEALEQRRAEQE
jgi:sugar phosphate permease